jgi:hypothetical protein
LVPCQSVPKRAFTFGRGTKKSRVAAGWENQQEERRTKTEFSNTLIWDLIEALRMGGIL